LVWGDEGQEDLNVASPVSREEKSSACQLYFEVKEEGKGFIYFPSSHRKKVTGVRKGGGQGTENEERADG